MSFSLEEKVQQFAIVSRLGIITLQFLANYLIPDHDAGVFEKPSNPNGTKSQMDTLVELTLGGLIRWDAQYYLHIADYGYTYENTLAFFPLFPLIIRQSSYVVLFIINDILSFFLPATKNVISFQSALILVSIFLNNFLFVRSAMLLHRLSLLVLRSEKLAFISAILFCVNPASIFFSAAYSESLYSFLLFYGLLELEKKNSLVAYMAIGLTGAVRSNGLVNLGFIAYKYLKMRFAMKMSFFYVLIFAFGFALSAFPFIAYQFYSYVKFCFGHVTLPDFVYKYGVSKNFVFPGNHTVWCKRFIPVAYTYVQKHYWNVDFLNYYEIKQIPNFLLAAPMIYIVARGSFGFVKRYKLLILYLGFIDEDPGENGLPISIFPYAVHGTALTLFAIFMIHIQVTTRLLASSSPLPYWYSAQILSAAFNNSLEADVLKKLHKKKKIGECYYESNKNKTSRWRTFLFTAKFCGYSFFIKWYFLTYFFVGTLMFSNYLPWT